MVEPILLLTNALNPTFALLNGLHLNSAEFLASFLVSIQNLGFIGVLAFVLIYVLATVALVPGSILTLGAGVIFGVVWGSIYVLIGAIIGETVAFLLGRYLVRDWITLKFIHNQTFIALDRALKREGWKIIFLTRLSPIFPFSLLNYAFGITGIALKDYFFGSIGMIPMTITYVYFGSLAGDLATIRQASQLANPELQWAIKIIGFFSTIAATVYITRIAKKALARSLANI